MILKDGAVFFFVYRGAGGGQKQRLACLLRDAPGVEVEPLTRRGGATC